MSDLPVVLIASYNERPNLERLVPALLSLPVRVQVLVVDDSSPDGSGAYVGEMARREPRVHLLSRAKKAGYGPAMVAGFGKALEMNADRMVTMDADFSHDPNDVPRLLEGLDRADIAIGSRYAGGVRVLNWAPHRLLLSMGANTYVRTVLGLDIQDCTSGFRAYRREALNDGVLEQCHSCGYAFLVELLHRCVKRKRSVCEVPITYTERREGDSKMSKRVMLEAALAPWRLKFGARNG